MTPANHRDKCWQRRLVAEHSLMPQPRFWAVTGDRLDDGGELADMLFAHPGSYILKPRFGSNGVGVVRVTSDGSRLVLESDCPDTALFVDEFPAAASANGRNLLSAVATQRARYVDQATVGIPESTLGLSILEDEIPADRTDGAVFEPRIVMQRAADDQFAVLGGICKRITTPIGAVVARDFDELSLYEVLAAFLIGRPADEVEQTHGRLLTIGCHCLEALGPYLASGRMRVHQVGIDGRLCWNPTANAAELWFLEFQFGIGRIDGSAPPGYRTPAELRQQFGTE